MREILFKAKRKDNNEWVYGYIIKSYLNNTYFMATSEDTAKNYWESKPLPEVIPETISEYTGLTDKNGVKIFENDVMKNKRGGKGIVKYSKYAEFTLDFIDDTFVSSFHPSILRSYEVIGNIFDEGSD